MPQCLKRSRCGSAYTRSESTCVRGGVRRAGEKYQRRRDIERSSLQAMKPMTGVLVRRVASTRAATSSRGRCGRRYRGELRPAVAISGQGKPRPITSRICLKFSAKLGADRKYGFGVVVVRADADEKRHLRLAVSRYCGVAVLKCVFLCWYHLSRRRLIN